MPNFSAIRPAQRFGGHSRKTHGGGASSPPARARVITPSVNNYYFLFMHIHAAIYPQKRFASLQAWWSSPTGTVTAWETFPSEMTAADCGPLNASCLDRPLLRSGPSSDDVLFRPYVSHDSTSHSTAVVRTDRKGRV